MDIKATISAAPKELTDRQLVNTPIGPVCMSRTCLLYTSDAADE